MAVAPIQLGTVYRRSDDIIVRKVAGETLLVRIRGQIADLQRIPTLNNNVAMHIWQRLDGRRDLTAILRSIMRAFEVSRERASRDLLAFCSDLSRAGLISVARVDRRDTRSDE